VANGSEATNARPTPAAPLAPVTTLAPLEANLTRLLMDEGIVIRGHDVARVVGLMAGAEVAWESDATA
jgi:hypothetical protein